MATYIMADIHGCYREFMQLLDKVKFNEKKDKLYILGDIIDRGPGTEEVFDWVYKRYNKSVYMCIGNHEDMFCEFVDYYDVSRLMTKLRKKYGDKIYDVSWVLASDLKYEIKEKVLFYSNFVAEGKHQSYDKYGTIMQLAERGKDIRYLHKMRDFFRKLPYYFKLNFQGREIYLVHAYISEPVEECDHKEMIWSRAYPDGEPGIPGKTIFFGHTPTNGKRYNGRGGVIVTKINNAVTINIDCGCCWRTEKSKLAIVSLEEKKIYYSNILKNKFTADAG